VFRNDPEPRVLRTATGEAEEPSRRLRSPPTPWGLLAPATTASAAAAARTAPHEDEENDDYDDREDDSRHNQPAGATPAPYAASACLPFLVCHETNLLGRVRPVTGGWGLALS
jgi:hypothetical protein